MLVLTFTCIPFIDTLILSFKNAKLFLPEETVTGAANYKAVLTHSRFWYSLFITLLFVLVSISLETLVGLCVGLMMNRLSPITKALRIMILIPWTIPTVVTARMWQWMFDYNLGIINYLLQGMGIDQVNWLGNPWLAFFFNYPCGCLEDYAICGNHRPGRPLRHSSANIQSGGY